MGLYTDWQADVEMPNVEKVNIAGIATEMRQSLEQWFNGHIQIVDPKTSTTVYDALNDTGGSLQVREIIFDSGPNGALIQPIRSAAPLEFGRQATSIQGIRFQTVRGVPTEFLRSGLHVVVKDGGEDSQLVKMNFSLKDGFDSSLAWGRILEATVVASG